MTMLWTRRQALEWVFIGVLIGVLVLFACLLLVPHGNAASVKVPPGQLWTCHVAEAEADMMSGPEMYSQKGRLFAVYRLDRNHDGVMDMLTIHDVRGQTVHKFPRYYVYDKDFNGKPDTAFVDEMGNGICGEMRPIDPKDIVMEPAPQPEVKEGESCDMHEGENDPNNPKKEM